MLRWPYERFDSKLFMLTENSDERGKDHSLMRDSFARWRWDADEFRLLAVGSSRNFQLCDVGCLHASPSLDHFEFNGVALI